MTNLATERPTAVRTGWAADAAVVGLTAVAAGIAWVVWTQVLGVTLEAPVSGRVQEVGPGSVLATALGVSVAGAGILRLLQARTARGLRVWTVIAVLTCLVSLGGPASAPTTVAVAGLASLHVVVGVALIVGLRAVRRAG